MQRHQELGGALTQFKKALELNPNMPEAHINLGNIYLAQKDYTNAAGEYQKALELKPDNVLAHYNYGLVLTGQDNVEGAVNQYRETVRLNPNYANAYYALGLIYQSQNNLTDAVANFERYLAIEPTGTYSDSVKSTLDKIHQTTGQPANPGTTAAAGGDTANSGTPNNFNTPPVAPDRLQSPSETSSNDPSRGPL
jgi:tetratricopeptide (TPR) repeat protein